MFWYCQRIVFLCVCVCVFLNFILFSKAECCVSLRYMKGRATYDQVNAVVQSINTAVTAKYKILRQSLKSLNSNARKLHQRFKNQETKDTKGISLYSFHF